MTEDSPPFFDYSTLTHIDVPGVDSLLFLHDTARSNLAYMGDRINREVAMSRRDKEIETEATQQAHYIQWGLIMVGGPAVEFPANIFEYQKKSFVQTTTKQAETSGNKWKQADHGLMGGALSTMTFSPLPSPPP